MKNFNLTKNITFNEYMEGQLPFLARKKNWDFFNKLDIQEQEQFIKRATRICEELQNIRDWVNREVCTGEDALNREEFKVKITSGFRCQEWELHQKRSGKSQHTVSAVDFKILSSSLYFNSEVMKMIFEKYDKTWLGGIAIKEPTIRAGKIISTGFIHIDNRQPSDSQIKAGRGARWSY